MLLLAGRDLSSVSRMCVCGPPQGLYPKSSLYDHRAQPIDQPIEIQYFDYFIIVTNAQLIVRKFEY